MSSRLLLHAAALLALGSGGCGPRATDWVVVSRGPDSAGTPALRITGVIRHLDVEGGVYTIRGDDSMTYEPTNLPAAFQEDGLLVEAEGSRRDDLVGIHQVGPLVELERIRRR